MKRLIFLFLIVLTSFGCEINYDSKSGTITYTDNKTNMLVSFYFDDIENGLASDAVGEINGKQVLVTVPRNTSTFLTPTVITTGGSAEIKDMKPDGTVDITKTIVLTITGKDDEVETYYVYVDEAAEGSKEILSFRFVEAGISGKIEGLDIYLYMPDGTTTIYEEPRIRHTGMSVECQSDKPDYTIDSKIQYTVTASDGSSITYTAHFIDSTKSAKEFIIFKFENALNNFANDKVAHGTIYGTDIVVNILDGTDVGSLKATFEVSPGATVEVDGVPQESGVSENDFNLQVVYTVIAKDGTTKDFNIIINYVKDNSKEIVSFIFYNKYPEDTVINPNLPGTYEGTISADGKKINITVPYNIDLRSLAPKIDFTGESIYPKDLERQDFRKSLIYTVTAADGSTREYEVIVTKNDPPKKDILEFKFEAANNSELSNDLVGTINNTLITVVAPYELNLNALVPTIKYYEVGDQGDEIPSIFPSPQDSQNFDDPQYYTLTANDETTKTYTVLVKRIAIKSFVFDADFNDTYLEEDVTGIINDKNIELQVPQGISIRNLRPGFSIIGDGVLVDDVKQVSDVSAQDFRGTGSSPMVYTVYKKNDLDKVIFSRSYNVSVSEKQEHDLTYFAFENENNESLYSDAVGRFSGNEINITVPFDADVENLIASFNVSHGAVVKVNGDVQESGATVNDFTEVKVYTVEAYNGESRDYVVKVTRELDYAKDIKTFYFLIKNKEGVAERVEGKILSTDISFTLNYGTDLTKLAPVIEISEGATISPESGKVADFSRSVTYTVTAEDGSKRFYNVTVDTFLGIDQFDFKAENNDILDVDVVGEIVGKNITVRVPVDYDITIESPFELIPTINYYGDEIEPSIAENLPQDFSKPMTYTVTSNDGSKVDYEVKVVSNTCEILRFRIYDWDFTQINGNKINIELPGGSDYSFVQAFFIHNGKDISIVGNSEDQKSGVTFNDFTSPVIYQVTAGDGTTKNYTVNVTVKPLDWQGGEIIKNDTSSLSYFKVETGSSGNAIAIWTQYGDNGNSLYAKRYIKDSGWEAADIIHTGSIGQPVIAFDSNGNAFCVWVEYGDSNTNLMASIYRPGSEWTTPQLLEQEDAEVSSPHITSDSNGNVIVVWQQDWKIISNRYNVITGWEGPESLIKDPGYSGQSTIPQIVVDTFGNAIVVWQEYMDSIRSIRFNKYTYGSGWGNEGLVAELNPSAVMRTNAQLAIDKRGNVIVLWTELVEKRYYSLWSSTYVIGDHVSSWTYAECVNPENRSRISDANIVLDPSGKAMALWYQIGEGRTSNVYFSNYTMEIGWGTTQILGAGGRSPQLAIDKSGKIIATWMKYGDPVSILSNIHLPGSGWQNVELVKNVQDVSVTPQLVIDSSDTAMVFWTQWDGDNYDFCDLWVNYSK